MLPDGKANCQGYADAFYLLASLAGFDVRILGSDDHAWNSICINNNWYTVDATFNDINDHASDVKTYIWFNAPVDTDEHEPYGGMDMFDWLVNTPDYSMTYYNANSCLFTDIDSAMAYISDRGVNHSDRWTHIMIQGTTTPGDILSDTLYEQVDRLVSYGYIGWSEYYKYVNGSTYLTVFWE